jgi:hypothetical protein
MQLELEDLECQHRAVSTVVGVLEGQTKSSNNLDDRKALTDSERWKIKCAMKHFDAIEIEPNSNAAPTSPL